jgi:nucleoside-diphosphate-sugar epimerase
MPLPRTLDDESQLDELLSRPSQALADDLARAPGDIVILGVGGKMGPTLARMARRAAPARRVIGVARFSQSGLREELTAAGIDCIEADLLSRDAVARLPDAPNVVFMAGRKFGSTGSEWLTWAMNAYVPALVAERYARSRIVAFSTICVYPYADVTASGASEDVPPTAPSGEYANSCVARERIFEHFSHLHGTPGCLIRLSYAIDMRYGVLHDIAQSIVQRRPIDLAMGYANVIWQGEACEWALRMLAHCTAPTAPLNVSGPIVGVRRIAAGLAERLGIVPVLTGIEAPTAWIADCSRAFARFGAPQVTLETMLDWTAAWVARGGASLGKPTHFEVRDGHY